MKNINHRNIRLISEDLSAYDTTIRCENYCLPERLLDTRKGKLFQKVKTIFEESGNSRVIYSEVLIRSLSSVEVVTAVDAKYSVD